jgi:hypothetical protein
MLKLLSLNHIEISRSSKHIITLIILWRYLVVTKVRVDHLTKVVLIELKLVFIIFEIGENIVERGLNTEV